MKKTVVILALFALTAGASPLLAHQWGCWKQPNTTVVTRNTAALGSQAAAALNEWNGETCLSIPTVSYHTEVSVYDGYYGGTGWAGLASIQSASGCNILHCHAQVNRSYSYSSNGYRGIFCQEVGHCFGLDHSNDGGCMGGGYFYSISSGTGYTVVPHNSTDIANMYGCDSPNPSGPRVDLTGTKHDGPAEGSATAHAFWVNQPGTLAETIELSKAIVEARVVGVWDAPDIVVPQGLNTAEDARVPNQRISFEVTRVIDGKVSQTFELFHTGNSEYIVEGDPPYEVGQFYLLFLMARGDDDVYLVVSPEGRFQMTPDGLAPASERDFAENLSGAPASDLSDYVREYRSASRSR